MNKSITETFFLLLMFFLFSQLSNANDAINTTQSIRYNQTLVSSRRKFELGFFSPGSSNNWYAGIWYKNIAVKTVVWVANREIPLKNRTSAELKLTQTGILVILDQKNIIWSCNSSGPARNPVLQLLDSGNLVLREENDNNYLWQSFDHPTHTFLPGMKLGLNFVTGREYQLSSWKNDEDPAPGDFTLHMDPTGYPQVLIKRGGITQYRVGPWNGMAFSGAPNRRKNPNEFKLPMNKNGVYFNWNPNSSSVITRFTLNSNGVGQKRGWVDQTLEWVPYLNIPADNCDNYKFCGVYGSCSIGYFPVCGCLDRFVPKDPEGWARADWSKGCVRRRSLNCEGRGDGFLKYSGIKLPDAQNSWYNESMTLEECKVECLKNCNCMAYSNLDITRGSGCLLWFGDLVDIRAVYIGGQDLYIRMASSELEDGKRREKLILSFATVGVGLLGLSLLLYIWKSLKNVRKRRKIWADFLFSTDLVARNHTVTHYKDLELPLFDFSTISKATSKFSLKNKLGEGGYGPVYKGTLEGGQDIAVKRLSKTSNQGLDEFKNEVICISRLQHRNLVKLLGCCIQGDEKMLIYEYMPNKSLDLALFDERERMYFDWTTRFNIVNGIARGLMYLHQDSRLRIIHRDLKASNILLDSEMNPKISDFGIAKRFNESQTEDKTVRVIGTYGYMSPEYAVHGRFSTKSDIFSFGVLVLEIVSGKRNSSFSHGDHHHNLLGHAWKLYNEGRSVELVDTYQDDSTSFDEMLRVIHVGLLCVQKRPDDRPTMTSVISMLNNEVLLPQVNSPGFFTESDTLAVESNKTSPNLSKCTNEVTITMLQGR